MADKALELKLLELSAAMIQHCQALKGVTSMLEQGNVDAAISRLDCAVTALHAVVRGQCVGSTMACPNCGTEQDVVAWVDDKTCDHCGATLEQL
jgi:hypothetical protein